MCIDSHVHSCVVFEECSYVLLLYVSCFVKTSTCIRVCILMNMTVFGFYAYSHFRTGVHVRAWVPTC